MSSKSSIIKKKKEKGFYSMYKTSKIPAVEVNITDETETHYTINGSDFKGAFTLTVTKDKVFDTAKESEENAAPKNPQLGECRCTTGEKKWLRSKQLTALCGCKGRMLILKCNCRTLEIPKITHRQFCNYGNEEI